MAKKKRAEKPKKLKDTMRTKLMVLFCIILVTLTAMVGVTIRMVTVKGEEYSRKLLSLQGYGTKTIPYERGDITDANGTVLATSIAVYDIILDCSVLLSKDDYKEPTLTALHECFPQLDMDEVEQYMEENPDSMYNILEKDLTYSQIEEFQKKKDEDSNIKGIWFQTRYKRNYPMGSLAASVIGFTSSGDVGTTGLEYYYNSTLNGINGREYGFLNSDNAMEKTVIGAQDGNTIVTSLDANIQSIVESKIEEFYNTYACNYREGGGFENCSVVVMNPNTGEIYAMADGPNFDLNDPYNLDDFYTEEQQEKLEADARSKFLNELWQNYAVYEAFEPGSVQKPLTVACALDNGDISPDDTFYCDGKEEILDRTISCVNKKGHKQQSVTDALKNSCNDSLMQMSYRIGKEHFAEYQSILNFGQKTGIDLPGESSCEKLIYSADSMSKVDLATNCFGQNFNCTMVQMTSAFASLINGGSYYRPHLVTRVLDSDGNTVSSIEPTLVKQTISKETSDTIKEMLKQVVIDGTGKTAKVDGYSMGGKTGTAETVKRDKENYVVSFMGYVPADDPQVIIYCVVDRPNVSDQSHSYYAQNIVREILEEILTYMNIYPDEQKTGENANLGITGNNPPNYTAIIQKGSIWEQKLLKHGSSTDTSSTGDNDTGNNSGNDNTGTDNTGTDNTGDDNTGNGDTGNDENYDNQQV